MVPCGKLMIRKDLRQMIYDGKPFIELKFESGVLILNTGRSRHEGRTSSLHGESM